LERSELRRAGGAAAEGRRASYYAQPLVVPQLLHL
jgi:hypothetical protein